ncbi:YhbY family RNA-binding protein, partial [Turicimonas muris]
MAQLKLPRDERITLRAAAHHLDPVVLLGASGLTEAVKKEVGRALDAHELIKVRVPS